MILDQLNKMPVVEASIKLSEDKKWVIHKTIITDWLDDWADDYLDSWEDKINKQ